MKKRTIAKTGATMLTMAMLLNGTTVFAADNSYPGVKGGSTAFDKYLVMDQEANVPNASFTYTIEPGTAKTYNVGDKKFEVLAGVGTPTMTDEDTTADGYQLVFKPTDTLNKTVQTGDLVKNFDATKQGYAKKTSTVDFSGVTFKEPGIYRYVITETGTNQAVTNDKNEKRYLDVYVVNDNVNGGCKIDASVFTEAAVSPTFSGDKQAQYGEKNSEITDAYQTYELSLDKVVEGNMGDKNRKFNFTINFSGPANTSFTFGNELITLDSNGSGSVNLQLSHEDAAAEITGIPSTVTYTVTENLNSSEGYDTDFAVSKGTGTSQAVAKDEAASDAAKVTAQQQTMTKADNAVTVTNRRVAASPTGVMLSITPYALSAGLASLLGALFFRRKKLS